MEFAELAALIRMSHKYHVEDVHARAMHHLKLYFTNDLSTWDTAGADGNIFLHITPPDALAAVVRDEPGGGRADGVTLGVAAPREARDRAARARRRWLPARQGHAVPREQSRAPRARA